MKTVTYTIGMILTACSAFAQTPDEWLHQKETKLKYILEQIVALKTYASAINAGYTTAGKGLKNIFSEKAGDFTQHETYFESFRRINPVVKTYGKSLAVPKLYQGVLNGCTSMLQVSQRSEWLTKGQKVYVQQVCERLLKDCTDLVTQWWVVTTDSGIALTDAERLQQIDVLYNEMQDRFHFQHWFSSEVRVLLLNSRGGKKEMERLSVLQGLK